MKSFSPKEIIKLLEERGFVLDQISGSHYIYMLSNRSKRVIVPMHHKDLPKGTRFRNCYPRLPLANYSGQ